MDPVTMTYYAAICAALGVAAPMLGGTAIRVLAGVIVGVCAAAALPFVRTMLGL